MVVCVREEGLGERDTERKREKRERERKRKERERKKWRERDSNIKRLKLFQTLSSVCNPKDNDGDQ